MIHTDQNALVRDVHRLRSARQRTPQDLHLIDQCHRRLEAAGLLSIDLGGGASHLRKVISKQGALRGRGTHADVMPRLRRLTADQCAVLGHAVNVLCTINDEQRRRQHAVDGTRPGHLSAGETIQSYIRAAQTGDDVEWLNRWSLWLAFVTRMDMVGYGGRPVALAYFETLRNYARGDGPQKFVELRRGLPDEVVAVWRTIVADKQRYVREVRPAALPADIPRLADLPEFEWPRAGGTCGQAVRRTPLTPRNPSVRPSMDRTSVRYYEGAGGRAMKLVAIAAQDGPPHCECCGEYHHPGNLELDHIVARCHFETYERGLTHRPDHDAIVAFAASIGNPTHIDDPCNQQVLCATCHHTKGRLMVTLPALWALVSRSDDYCTDLPNRSRHPVPWRAVSSPSAPR